MADYTYGDRIPLPNGHTGEVRAAPTSGPNAGKVITVRIERWSVKEECWDRGELPDPESAKGTTP